MFSYIPLRSFLIIGMMSTVLASSAYALQIEAGSSSYQITSGSSTEKKVEQQAASTPTKLPASNTTTSAKKPVSKKPVTTKVTPKKTPTQEQIPMLHGAAGVDPLYTLNAIVLQPFMKYVQSWHISSPVMLHGSAEQGLMEEVVFFFWMGICFFLFGVFLILFSRPLRFK